MQEVPLSRRAFVRLAAGAIGLGVVSAAGSAACQRAREKAARRKFKVELRAGVNARGSLF